MKNPSLHPCPIGHSKIIDVLLNQMFKRDLVFHKPVMNAAGTLGFSPDFRATVPWDEFGAFVTNPLSLRPRKITDRPALIEFPGGFLLHTGLPNPGINSVINKYARRWVDSPLPIIVNLMADRPEEAKQMVKTLEGIDNVMAVELGFAPLLADDIILLAIEMCRGELPLIVSLAVEQVLSLGPRAVERGAAVLSTAAPHGMLPMTPVHSQDGGDGLISGRIFGPALFPRSLKAVHSAARLGLPVIGAGGVYTFENVDVMLAAGALWVQMDAGLWLPSKEKEPRQMTKLFGQVND
jgi:dihydroorotate dehydrogenase